MVNSSLSGLHDEITRLKEILKKNGYPENFLDRCILKFFNKVYETKPTVTTVPKKEVRIILPFLGSSSLSVKNSLKKLYREILPFCSLQIVFKTGNKLSSHFKFKDSLPGTLRSGVVYQFKCAKCNLSYVGSTWRFWERRLQEHLHISALTGKPLSGGQIYAPMQHARTCQYHLKRDDFSIIGSEKNRYLLRLKESIFIYKLRPQLNGTESSVKLHLFVWFLFFWHFIKNLKNVGLYVCLTLILTCLVIYVAEDGYSDIRIYQLMVKILRSICLVKMGAISWTST